MNMKLYHFSYRNNIAKQEIVNYFLYGETNALAETNNVSGLKRLLISM